MPYDITYMWHLNTDDTDELIYKTEAVSQTQKRNLCLPKEKEGRGKSGIQDWQIQTTKYKVDKQQGPTVQQRELYSVSCNKP